VTLLSQVHFGYDSPHPVGTALRDALGAQIDDLVPWHVILEAERKERMEALEGTQVIDNSKLNDSYFWNRLNAVSTQVFARKMVPMSRDLTQEYHIRDNRDSNR